MHQIVVDARAMAVPAPIVKLHEPHAALDQPAREQAIVGKRSLAGRGPVRLQRCGDSRLMSITSGTETCMRNASSYCSMRASVSGEPNSLACARFKSASASRLRRRTSRLMPGGLSTNRIGSPDVRHCTP